MLGMSEFLASRELVTVFGECWCCVQGGVSAASTPPAVVNGALSDVLSQPT